LDPWNELEHRRPTDKSETEFISESLGQIRRFARFNKVHVWIVAHPTKLKRKDDGTYPVPRLYDISGSAAFYNKADNGICIHRKDPRKPEVDVHVQKIRFKEIGKLGKAQLGFIADTGTYFDNLAKSSS
jgi:twinkle protein